MNLTAQERRDILREFDEGVEGPSTPTPIELPEPEKPEEKLADPVLEAVRKANERAAEKRLKKEQRRRETGGVAPVSERETKRQTTIPAITLEDLTRAGVPLDQAEGIIARRPEKPASTAPIRQAEERRVSGVKERETFLRGNVVVGDGEFVDKKAFEKLEAPEQAKLKEVGVAQFNMEVDAKEKDRRESLARVERFKDEKGNFDLVAALVAGTSKGRLERAGFDKEDIAQASDRLKAQRELRRDFHAGTNNIDLVGAIRVGRTNKKVAKAIELAGFAPSDLRQARDIAREIDGLERVAEPTARPTSSPTKAQRLSQIASTGTPRQILGVLQDQGTVPKSHVFVGTTPDGQILTLPKKEFDSLPAVLKRAVEGTQRGNPLALLDTDGMTAEQKDARYKRIGLVAKDALRVGVDESGEPLYATGKGGQRVKETDDLKQFVAVRDRWAEHPETGLQGAITHVVPRSERGRAHDHAAKLFRAAEKAGILSPSETETFKGLHGMTGPDSAFAAIAAVSLPLTVAISTTATALNWNNMSTEQKALSVGLIAALFIPLGVATAIRSARGTTAAPSSASWVQSVKAGNNAMLREAPSSIRPAMKVHLQSRLRLAQAIEKVRSLEQSVRVARGEVQLQAQKALAVARRDLRSFKATYKSDTEAYVKLLDSKGILGARAGETPGATQLLRLRFGRLQKAGALPKSMSFKQFQLREVAKGVQRDTLEVFAAVTRRKDVPIAKTVANMRKAQNTILDAREGMRTGLFSRSEGTRRIIAAQRTLTKEHSRLALGAYQQGDNIAVAVANARAEVVKVQNQIRQGEPGIGARQLSLARAQVKALESVQASMIRGWKQYKYRPIEEPPGLMQPSGGRTITSLKPTHPKAPVAPPGTRAGRSGVAATPTSTLFRGVSNTIEAVGQPLKVPNPVPAPAPFPAKPKMPDDAPERPARTPSTHPAPVRPGTSPTTQPEPVTTPASPGVVVRPVKPSDRPTRPVRAPGTGPRAVPRKKTAPGTGISAKPKTGPVQKVDPVPAPQPQPTPARTEITSRTELTGSRLPPQRAQGGGAPPIAPFALPGDRRLPPGVFPLKARWVQGKSIVTYDFQSGKADFSANLGDASVAPNQTFSLLSTTSRAPSRRRLELGIVVVDITQKGVTFRKSAELGSRVNGKRLRSRQRLRLR